MCQLRTSWKKKGRTRNLVCEFVLAGIILHGWAAEPLDPHASYRELPARGTGMMAGPLPQIYIFEIAAYLRNNQKSEEDSNYFTRILDQIPGWNSRIDATEETYLALRKKCTDQNLICDVVSLVEKSAGDKMTLEIDVFTTPSTHLALHAGSRNINGKTIECNLQSLGEKDCRKVMMGEFADKLAGLDKLHRPQGGGN